MRLSFLAVMSVAHAATTEYLASLQCFLEILWFLNDVIGAPIFISIMCGGTPLKFGEI